MIPNQSNSFGYDMPMDEKTKAYYANLLEKANLVPLKSICRYYKILLDDTSNKIICPLPKHQENSASFIFYHETNSFNCFGCKAAGGAVNFVAHLKETSKVKAAQLILEIFNSEEDYGENLDIKINYPERLSILTEFSSDIRNFIQTYRDPKSVQFIDKLMSSFDYLNAKHHLNNDALKNLIESIKEKIEKYSI